MALKSEDLKIQERKERAVVQRFIVWVPSESRVSLRDVRHIRKRFLF